jgi:disulfide bond formation protein DsbB
MSQTSSPQIDPRGPRFTAAVTLVLLAVVLLIAPSVAGTTLLAVQTAFFAIGAGLGVQRTPTAYVFKKLVRPRLAAPDHLEHAAPPRFAQAVGLVFSVVALAGFATGITLLGQIAAGFAIIAATLNAVFGLCLGCELYLLGLRLSSRGRDGTAHTTTTESNKEEVAA